MDARDFDLEKRLAGRDPNEILRTTPTLLAQLEDGGAIDDDSAGLMIARMADLELVTGWRLRQTVAIPGVEIASYEPDVWAERHPRLHGTLGLDAFRALRAWNLALMTTFSLSDWLDEAFHPTFGFVTVDVMVRQLAVADLDHLRALGVELPAPL